MPDTHVECSGVTKRFGGTVALDDVDVSFFAGTVHAVVGENGAGKSTLGKVISGVLVHDEGDVYVKGEQVNLRSPHVALGHKITVVAQELTLLPARSVVDNVFLGMESHRGPFVSRAADARRYRELSEQYEIDLPSDVRVADLSVADQQKVEILRALARDAELVVMDEPTARLTSEEAMTLRGTVRSLVERGVTIVYISHFLDEVLAVADRVTVMRDGRVVRTGDASAETKDSLIEGVVGRTFAATFPDREPVWDDARVALEVQGLERADAFADVSFQVRDGEIVTVAGLVGSGRTELLRAIYGADRTTGGSMRLHGEDYTPRSPKQAIRRGVAMIPESRRSHGLLMLRSVRDNVSLAHLDMFTAPAGLVRVERERAAATRATTDVNLTGATVESQMDELSGGNQQKSLFARWLVWPPKVLLADEPTRGVDVGAKRGIYELLVSLAADGMAVVVVSSELEEVLGIGHRILVMRNGRLAGELPGDTATGADVMELAFGVAAA